MRIRGLDLRLCAVLVALGAVACSEDPVALDFTRPAQAAPTRPRRSPERLVVGIGAMLGPEETYESHAALVRYVARAAGREADIVQRRTYQEMNRLLADGDVDIAFICTGAYVAVRDQVVFLAAPILHGEPTYRSLIIARRGGPASMDELRGKRFAFTDPLSNTGRLFPIYLVQRRFDMSARDFFGAVTYSGAHDESVRLVASGLVDGAAVDGHVFRRMLGDHPEWSERIVVLERSPPFGSPPFVARADLPASLISQLRAILLGAGDDPRARPLLDRVGIDGFAPTADYSLAVEVTAAATGEAPGIDDTAAAPHAGEDRSP